MLVLLLLLLRCRQPFWTLGVRYSINGKRIGAAPRRRRSTEGEKGRAPQARVVRRYVKGQASLGANKRRERRRSSLLLLPCLAVAGYATSLTISIKARARVWSRFTNILRLRSVTMYSVRIKRLTRVRHFQLEFFQIPQTITILLVVVLMLTRYLMQTHTLLVGINGLDLDYTMHAY